MNMHWKCEICGKIRHDSDISVLTYGLIDFKGICKARRHLKYCKDSPECYKIAVEKSKTGKV